MCNILKYVAYSRQTPLLADVVSPYLDTYKFQGAISSRLLLWIPGAGGILDPAKGPSDELLRPNAVPCKHISRVLD